MSLPGLTLGQRSWAAQQHLGSLANLLGGGEESPGPDAVSPGGRKPRRTEVCALLMPGRASILGQFRPLGTVYMCFLTVGSAFDEGQAYLK